MEDLSLKKWFRSGILFQLRTGNAILAMEYKPLQGADRAVCRTHFFLSQQGVTGTEGHGDVCEDDGLE